MNVALELAALAGFVVCALELDRIADWIEAVVRKWWRRLR